MTFMKIMTVLIAFSLPIYLCAQSYSSGNENQSTPSNDAKKVEKTNSKEANGKEADKKDEKEKPKSAHTFVGSVSFVSDYRFRGISKTMRRPAVQGTMDYSHVSGFYLGTFGSNVDGTTHLYNNTSMEWDFYGGFKGKLLPCSLPDFSYNVGLIYYYYPGGQAFVPERVRYNTLEYYIEISYKWLSFKYSQTLTNYFGVCSDNPPINYEYAYAGYPDRPNGNSRGSIYFEFNASFDIWKKMCFYFVEGGKLNLLFHAGHEWVRHYDQISYTDWRVTLTQEFDWFNIFFSYVGTNANPDYYDIPDNAYHPKKRHLGVQGIVVGVIRVF